MDTTDIATTSEVTTFGWVILVVVLGVIIFAVIRRVKSDRRFKLSKLKILKYNWAMTKAISISTLLVIGRCYIKN